MTHVLEICVDSLTSARNAVLGGASRLEVCSALHVGGLTPSWGLVQSIQQMILEMQSNQTIPLHVMLRCRPGDFLYSPDEMQV